MIKIVLYHLQLTKKVPPGSLEISTCIKFQPQKTYNSLIWGQNTDCTFSRSTESLDAFLEKNINIDDSIIIRFYFI
jgi:hypothetical protein